MIADCLAVILVGGDSRRMGRDKAMIRLDDGDTLLQCVATRLQTLFPQLALSVRQPRPAVDLPQIPDRHPGSGPLAGMAAALAYAQQAGFPWIFAVATDMPFVQPRLIEYLAAYRCHAVDAVVPQVAGHPQPMAAFYATGALSAIQAQLQCAGKRSLRAALERLQVRYVDEAQLQEADPDLHSFFDLDTPQDLAAAEHFLRSQSI